MIAPANAGARGGDADPRLGVGAPADRGGWNVPAERDFPIDLDPPAQPTPAGYASPGSPGCPRGSPRIEPGDRATLAALLDETGPTRSCTAPTCTSAEPGPSRWPAGTKAPKGETRGDHVSEADGGLAEGAVEQARIAEAMAQLALEAADRVKVLRGAGVLVRG